MQYLRRKLLFELYKLLDAGIMLVVLAFVIVFFSLDSKDHLPNFFVFFSYHIKLINVVLLGVLIFIWPAIFSSFGLYKSQRLGIINKEFLKILKAVGVGTMLFAFKEGVRRLKREIRRGEIFQAVLSDCFEFSLTSPAFEVYRKLRIVNPSPYMFFIGKEGDAVLGASPEMLVRVTGRDLQARQGLVETA